MLMIEFSWNDKGCYALIAIAFLLFIHLLLCFIGVNSGEEMFETIVYPPKL